MRAVSATSVLRVAPLGFSWETNDPFLFCVYHRDQYPRGQRDGTVNSSLLAGRDIGMDFTTRDGFRMYHGENGVPGFPAHPHRGFETITIVTQGLIDHHDSMGASARFGSSTGGGDVQWVTTGRGIQHSEMFPLVHSDKENPLELFQIWLNLPAKSKMCTPYFTMMWSEKIPVVQLPDQKARITIIADAAQSLGVKPLAPPPDSWASDPKNFLSILLIDLEAEGRWTIPALQLENKQVVHRKIFVFAGEIEVDSDTRIPLLHSGQLDVTRSSQLVNRSPNQKARVLMLQASPISEPVAQRGPFVMNTQQELMQTFVDYQRTRFGGWPWESSDPIHPLEKKRFAKHPDGRIENPETDYLDKSEL